MALAALTVTNVIGIIDSIRNTTETVEFLVIGTIVGKPAERSIVIRDDTGSTRIFASDDDTNPVKGLKDGDEITVHGSIRNDAAGRRQPVYSVTRPHVMSSEPLSATAKEIKRGSFDNKLVRLSGTVAESFQDVIDLNWHFIVLENDGESIYVAVRSGEHEKLDRLSQAEITLTGICRIETGSRGFLGRTVIVYETKDIRILRTPPTDPFAVPSIDESNFMSIDDTILLRRYRVSGQVLCRWRQNCALIRDRKGQLHKIEFAAGPQPVCGDWIDAVGKIETDLYHMNISRAIWRRTTGPLLAKASPILLRIKDLFSNATGKFEIQDRYNGKTVRLAGIVQAPSFVGDHPDGLILRDDDQSIPVDIRTLRRDIFADISVGSTAEITGICIVESETWHSYSQFPRVSGITLVPQDEADIRILARPPWWTTGRLLSVIGSLLAALVGIFAWNRILKRIAERRGRELMREQIRHVAADLKVEERTRLAVELHDSLSQVLTGVAMELDAAERFADKPESNLCKHLSIARKTLRSCHSELRNCLWDLRNQALEASDMNEAIRLTILPHVKNIRTQIRFNVARLQFSDNTAHAVLRIIRELTINAIRHGHATTIRIAGGIEGGTLLFSVTNNGLPFDPDLCPGVLQGHFGLEGIRERIKKFAGTLSVSSSPPGAVKVKITMKIVHPSEKNPNCI